MLAHPNDIFAHIRAALSNLEKLWIGHGEESELAYYALTSKPECPVRDKLAYALQVRLAPSLVVDREWRRVDLAVRSIPERCPKLVLEVKAMAAADCCRKSEARKDEYKGCLANDLRKLRNTVARCKEGPAPPGALLLLATHLPSGFTPQARSL